MNSLTLPSHRNCAAQARWAGIERPYGPKDIEKLRPSLVVEHSIARHGAQRLWDLLQQLEFVGCLGALSGSQAVQQVRAGLPAIYVSGWQVAADANSAEQMYPDQSLYPSNSVPALVRRINNALLRADQIERLEGQKNRTWLAPIVADAEAGFGGPLHAFELMKSMISAGAAGVHFEDQLAAEKKCGHLGGKVLVPTQQFVRQLVAARLAADVEDVPTLVIARTDAHSAKFLTSDVDPYDRPFISDRTPTHEGYFRVRAGVDAAIARALAYAPYADMLWWETSTPNLDEAQRFAAAIHARYPGKLLAYNCSPSFNWQQNVDESQLLRFQSDLAAMGYKFQFVTLAGYHSLNYGMFSMARDYRSRGMAAYAAFQADEFALARDGYTAVRHQHEVGTAYFDKIAEIVSQGQSSTVAMAESTECSQFG